MAPQLTRKSFLVSSAAAFAGASLLPCAVGAVTATPVYRLTVRAAPR